MNAKKHHSLIKKISENQNKIKIHKKCNYNYIMYIVYICSGTIDNTPT